MNFRKEYQQKYNLFFGDANVITPYEVVRLKRCVQLIRKHNEPGNLSLLDIGCGKGLLLEALREHWAIGLDLTPGNFRPSNRYVLGEAESLPFKDGCFDIVILMEVIEHIPTPEKALLEIKRVLGSNGTLLITTPNNLSYFETVAEWCKENKVLRRFLGRPIYSGVQHEKLFSPVELLELLKRHSFQIKEISAYGFILGRMLAPFVYGRFRMSFLCPIFAAICFAEDKIISRVNKQAPWLANGIMILCSR